jgi:hypothetical protein
MVLEELREDEYINPEKRVRALSTKELINLTKAWLRWPFKTQNLQFQCFVERGSDRREKAWLM